MGKRIGSLPSYKTFNKQRYGLNLTFDTKREANSLAKRLRAEGDLVRVTKEKVGGDIIYATWLKRGKSKLKPWKIPHY